MRASKLRAFVGLLALATLFPACNRGRPEAPSAADLATFTADPVRGDAEDLPTTANFAELAGQRLVHFTVCLKDVAAQAPVVGFRFRVKNGGTVLPLRQPTTDPSGCLYWSEHYQYKSSEQEAYLEEERTIEAVSGHQGAVVVRVGVNPWRTGAEAVRDLSVKDAPVARAKSAGTQASAALAIGSVETTLEVVPSKGKLPSARLRVSFQPKVRRIGTNGAPTFERLTTGKFRVHAQVVAITNEGEAAFTSPIDFSEVGFTEENVFADGRVDILRTISRRENTLELELSAEPLGADLRPVRGRVPLGRLSTLSLYSHADLRQISDPPGLQTIQPLVKQAPEAPAVSLDLGRISVVEANVKELDSSGRPHSLALKFKAVARNGITRDPILGGKFTLNDGRETYDVSSDPEDGVIRWTGTYDFDYFAKPDPQRQLFTLSSADGYYGKIPLQRPVWLDFWAYESPDQVAIDEEKDGPPIKSVVADGSNGAAELTLGGTFTNFMGRKFEVDEHLNISTTRRFSFELNPEIKRMSRNKGWLPPQNLGNGRFRVHFLLETNDDENPEVIDAQTMELTSRNGRFAEVVDLHYPDLRLAAARATLSVQILPLDRSTSLVSPPFVGTFEPTGGGIRFRVRKTDIVPRMALAPKANGLLEMKGAELFARARGYEFLSADKLKSLGLSDADLQTYATKGYKSSLSALCDLFFPVSFNPFSDGKRCHRDPSSWLAFVKTEHMNKLYSEKQVGSTEPSSISLGAGLSYSAGESEGDSISHGTSWSFGADAKLDVPGGKLTKMLGLDFGIGVGWGASRSSSHSWSKDKSHGTSRSYGEGKSVNVDQIDMKIDADIDQCTLLASLGAADPSKPRGYMFCNPKPVRKTFTEHYYFLAQGSFPGAVHDEGISLRERPLTAVIRGTDRFNEFKKLLQDPQVTLNLDRALPVPAELWKKSEQRYDGFFPGLLIPEKAPTSP